MDSQHFQSMDQAGVPIGGFSSAHTRLGSIWQSITGYASAQTPKSQIQLKPPNANKETTEPH
jgi:hypothetical protein